MQIHFKYLWMGLLASVFVFSPAEAKENGKGSGNKHKHSESGKKNGARPPGHADKNWKNGKADKAAMEHDLWLPAIKVEEARRYALLHDFGGQQPLPPGIRKNLMRGKPLPPGIAKKQLPAPYLTWLPSRPGYEWRACGTDVVLVSSASGLVAQVIVDVLR